MFDEYFAKIELSGFTKTEDVQLAKALAIRLGVSFFSIEHYPGNTNFSFMTPVPFCSANQYSLEAQLEVFAWVFDTPLDYRASFYSTPEPPKLMANTYSGDGRTVQLTMEQNSEAPLSSSGILKTGYETPVEELLSSENEFTRALGLLIVGLDLESFREKALRFKQANDFVV